MDGSRFRDSQHAEPVGTRDPRADGSDSVAAYRRGLLRLPVTAAVTLASKKQSIDQIVNLAPGMLIEFDKSCQAPLELEVGGRSIAEGVCVQIGDQIGLRITAIRR